MVLGVALSDRDSWVVTLEGRAPAFVLEILAQGHREKDLKNNVTRYAQLGIREYFLADLYHHRLYGWRLGDPATRLYTALVPQLGRVRSEVLGLDVKLEGGRVRLYYGSARLMEPDEITQRLRDDIHETRLAHVANLERLLRVAPRDEAEAKNRAEAEAAKDAAEARASAAEAELARLRAAREGEARRRLSRDKRG